MLISVSKLANEYSNVLDSLLNAYAQIADTMPDFSRIGSVFQDTPTVREVLALIYEDILEFHRRAYKFFRRRGTFDLRLSNFICVTLIILQHGIYFLTRCGNALREVDSVASWETSQDIESFL